MTGYAKRALSVFMLYSEAFFFPLNIAIPPSLSIKYLPSYLDSTAACGLNRKVCSFNLRVRSDIPEYPYDFFLIFVSSVLLLYKAG